MENPEELTILNSVSTKELLQKIDSLKGPVKSLFVTDNNGKIEGTVTDGDIRRGLIKGLTLENPVTDFMNKNFTFISDKNSIETFELAKKKGIRLLPLVNEAKEIVNIYNLNKIKAILPVDAVIMAGGKGKRLKPLTDNTPKPMLPLGNKSILEHNIDRLIKFGVDNIYISVNYLKDKIIDFFGDGSSKGIKIKYIEEEQSLGTAGSLSLIDKIENRQLILMNSDLFTDFNFYDLFKVFKSQNAAIAMASIPYSVNIPFSVLQKNGNKITGIKEKPQHTYYAGAGIYMIDSDILNMIPENKKYDAPDLVEDVIKKGKTVSDCPVTGYWIDIGRHEEYKKAQEIAKHINL